MNLQTADRISNALIVMSSIAFLSVMCFAGDDWDDDKGKGE